MNDTQVLSLMALIALAADSIQCAVYLANTRNGGDSYDALTISDAIDFAAEVMARTRDAQTPDASEAR